METKALHELREIADVTQEELGVTLGLAKTSIGTLEATAHPNLRSLKRYIEALGGKLSLHVELGKAHYVLDVGEAAQSRRKQRPLGERVHRVRRRIP